MKHAPPHRCYHGKLVALGQTVWASVGGFKNWRGRWTPLSVITANLVAVGQSLWASVGAQKTFWALGPAPLGWGVYDPLHTPLSSHVLTR